MPVKDQPEPLRNDRGATGLYVISMLIFGTIGLFRRYIPVPSAFLSCFRGLFGGLLLLLFTRLRKKDGPAVPAGRALPALALSGAVIGFNWMLLFEAYNHTTVAVATLCYYMQPTLVMLLSPLFFHERLTLRKSVCATIAVLGMILVSGVTEGAAAREGNLRGIVEGLSAAVCYAAVIILNKKVTGIDPYRKTTVQLLSAGIVMIPYLLFTGGFTGLSFTGATLPLLLTVGVIHTGLAYVLCFGSMDRLPAQSVAMLSYIDPVTALLVSALILREPLSPAGILGAVLIIGSAVVSELRGKAPAPP